MKKKKFLLITMALMICGCNGNAPDINSSSQSPSSNMESSSSSIHVHQINKVNSKNPTYTKEGNIDYYQCSKCKKVFLDSSGTKETTIENVMISPTTKFVQKKFETLNYCEYKPTNLSTKVPLVVFLHGAGERGDDNEKQLKNAILEVVKENSQSQFNQSVVIAPQCPSDKQWVNTPWANRNCNYQLSSVQETDLLKSVVKLVEEYRKYDFIDTNRVYAVGLSMGGFGVWDLVSRHSDLFTAASPICGAGPSDAIETLKDFPIYTFHGTNDTTVANLGTIELVNKIKQAGGKKIQYVSFEGDGHGIWNKAITYGGDKTHPSLENWLFSQNKNIEEKITRVACIGDSLTYGHSWHNESYPVFLQKKLGDKFIVENFGVNGSQITGFGGSGSKYKYYDLNRYTDSVKFNPDILFIMLGTNDATQWDKAKFTYENGYKSLIGSYQNVFPEAQIVLMTSPQTLDNNGFGIPNEKIGKYVYPLQRKIASDLKLPLIDIRDAFSKHEGGYESLLKDGVHLSIEGAELVVEKINTALKEGLSNYVFNYDYVDPDLGKIIIEDVNDFTQIDEEFK